ncbi:AAA family ATPase [candidate division KSB1 bacterium]|nr:AAA family ATPase [candidate division KSB1 bacterium]
MSQLEVKNFGQINQAHLNFGDLTVLVGPQASGKSIVLQLLKLLLDYGQIQQELNRYGLDWERDLNKFLNVYFGEGMHSLYKNNTQIQWRGTTIDLSNKAARMQKSKHESLFFIPAQRVLALRDGWPRPFTDYSSGDPFIVREFSEKLRILMEQELRSSDNLFPQQGRLKKEMRDLLQKHIFSNYSLNIDKLRSQKRLVLGAEQNGNALPYMVWSAGQREFVPLLLGLYWLMPPSRVAMKNKIKWVVLEEIEMGLHPHAISVVLLFVFELLLRGYKVCLSTHSPQVLDALWAVKRLAENSARPEAFLRLFDVNPSQPMKELAESMMNKVYNVYYFDRSSGYTVDISNLDPASDRDAESDWGGLVEFSGRANELVAQAVNEAKR